MDAQPHLPDSFADFQWPDLPAGRGRLLLCFPGFTRRILCFGLGWPFLCKQEHKCQSTIPALLFLFYEHFGVYGIRALPQKKSICALGKVSPEISLKYHKKGI